MADISPMVPANRQQSVA